MRVVPPLDLLRLALLEPVSERRTRRIVLLAFLAFYIACVPLWYATSRVYRVQLATLPTEAESGESLRHLLPVELHVLSSSSAASSWAADVAQPYLHAQLHSRAHAHLQWDVQPWNEQLSKAPSAVVADLSKLQADVRALSTALDAYVSTHSSPGSAPSAASLPSWHLVVLFVDQSTTVQTPAPVWTMGTQRCAFTVMRADASDDERRSRLDLAVSMLQSVADGQSCTPTAVGPSTAAAASPTACAASRALSQRLSFILMNGADDQSDGVAEKWTWNFPRIERAFLDGFISSLSPYVTLSVDSSVLHFGHLTDAAPVATQVDADTLQQIAHLPQPVQSRIRERVGAIVPPAADAAVTPLVGHRLSSVSLKNLIGSVGEWNAQSPLVQASREMIAYIPPQRLRPMFFQLHVTQGGPGAPAVSLAVPRYGGVAIINSPGNCSSGIDDDTVACELSLNGAAKEVMQVFVQQIRDSLALSQTTAGCPSCVFLPDVFRGVSAWELDLLSSRLIQLNLAESLSVLRRLYELIASVPHMPVSEEIAQIVADSIRARDTCIAHLAARRWSDAGRASHAAAQLAHRAFFHPDMLPALYFPDEHLYAVYLPLFLPITLPMIAALMKAINRTEEKQRSAKKKAMRAQQQSQARDAVDAKLQAIDEAIDGALHACEAAPTIANEAAARLRAAPTLQAQE